MTKKSIIKESIFSKIIRRELSTNILYQDELVTAFHDSLPQAPIHILIIPNEFIPTLNHVTIEHEAVLGRMITTASNLAKQEGISKDGYRLILNCNQHGGQEIYHIHMHLVGGCSLGPILSLYSKSFSQC